MGEQMGGLRVAEKRFVFSAAGKLFSSTMERDSVDYSLYYVTGRLQLKPGQDFYENLEAACAGGVTIVQLREKNISTREFVELATRSKAITDKVSSIQVQDCQLD